MVLCALGHFSLSRPDHLIDFADSAIVVARMSDLGLGTLAGLSCDRSSRLILAYLNSGTGTAGNP